MSQIKVDQITDEAGTGAPEFPNGVVSSGNVGIGTNNSDRALHVVSSLVLPVRLQSTGTSSYIDFVDANTSGGTFRNRVGSNGNNLSLWTGGTESLRIDSSGFVGIGTSAPLSKLHVEATTTCLELNRDGNNGFVAAFKRSGTLVGNISVTTTATAYNTSSDYRLKEDVQPMVGASDRLMALKPVNFAWKVDGSRVDGFIAHEAQAVVPEAVVGEKDAVDAEGKPEYQGIDQSKLVPLLTAALQEALTEIASMKACIAALEAK